MEALIKFFIETGKLKTLKRRGWVLRGIKDPETVADHAYRVLVLAWLSGYATNLSARRLLKLALVHSLAAVYIHYISPYDKLLEIKNQKALLKKYPALVLRAPVDKKGKIALQRFHEENKAIKKLFGNLPEPIKGEAYSLWLDFQNRTSKEAKFLWVVDKLENLIQALEYKDYMEKDFLKPFLSQIDRLTDEKRILRLTDSLNRFFTEGESAVKNRQDKNLIKFIIEVGKVKKVLRKGWVIRGVKEPESLASHSFRSALMVWVLSSQKKIDQRVLIVMAIFHDLFSALTGDITPYDATIEKIKDQDKKKAVVESLPWIGSQAQKELLAKQRLDREVKALDKILRYLPHRLRHELKYFWLEYKTGASKEGRFFRQVDRIEALLQALEYQTKNKNLPITSFWLQLKELLDDPRLVGFVAAIDDYYFKKGFRSRPLDKSGKIV